MVYGAPLEREYTWKRIVGSNPMFSAILFTIVNISKKFKKFSPINFYSREIEVCLADLVCPFDFYYLTTNIEKKIAISTLEDFEN